MTEAMGLLREGKVVWVFFPGRGFTTPVRGTVRKMRAYIKAVAESLD